jgi:very-short-patch-repair endonuclease
MLLQEHDYFVLRFLAEDVGKQLDTVLDAILRAMSHRLRGSSSGPKPDGDHA